MSAVLIVDDEKDICEFSEFRLTHMGHSSLSAHNGVDALEVLKSHPEIKLVLSDVRMPKMDGIQLLSEIKAKNLVPHFIFMSGFSELNDEKAKKMGAEGLYGKPLDTEALLERIDALLKAS